MEIQAGLTHKTLEFQNAHWNKMFWLLAVIAAIILILAICEIFLKNDNNAGIEIISYAATLAMGFFGGRGYSNIKQN